MTAYYTTVTRKGQITIPAPVRRELGLEEGDRVEVSVEGGHARFARAESVAARTAGVFKAYAEGRPRIEAGEEEHAWGEAAIERDRETMQG